VTCRSEPGQFSSKVSGDVVSVSLSLADLSCLGEVGRFSLHRFGAVPVSLIRVGPPLIHRYRAVLSHGR